MFKKNLKTLIITGLISLLPFFVGLIVYPNMPEQIPIHYNIAGEVDNYGHKSFMLIMPFIILAIQWAAVLEAYVRDKKSDIKDHETYIGVMSWMCAMTSLIMGVFMYCAAFKLTLIPQRLIPAIVGAIFVVLSNVMPKYKQNRWFGMRVKWTLNDKDNWMKTHRVAGKVGVICGLLIMMLSLLPNLELAYMLMTVLMLLTIFVPTVYSWNFSKKKKSKETN